MLAIGTLSAVWHAADDEKASALRRRSAFRLLTELLLVGVYQDTAVLVNAIKSLAAMDFHRDKEAAQAALSLLASFAKGGRQDVLGLPNPMLATLSVEDGDEVTASSVEAFGCCWSSAVTHDSWSLLSMQAM